MKSRIAIALSVVGVLASGSAAVHFNTQAMKPTEVAAAPTAAIQTADQMPSSDVANTTTSSSIKPTTTTTTTTLPTTTTSTSPTTTAPQPTTTSTLPTTAKSPTNVAPPTMAPAAPTSAASSIYEFVVPATGTAQLDTAGGQLTVVETTSMAGWIVSSVERPNSRRVEITFISAGFVTLFSADFKGDTIYTLIETRNR